VNVIAVLLGLLVGTVGTQDPGALDVPVYRNAAFGVALPRPFPDWVFSPGGTPRTTTVLFHPRQGSLRQQLWGALVLTAFDGPAPLDAVADQRVQSTWRPALGRTFAVLTRDSLRIAGFPALHLVMSGAVNRLAVDVEEYFIARGTDLVILQFRYPRGLPRDSIAAGYQRAFDGLELRRGEPAAEPAVAAEPAAAPRRDEGAENRRLAGSPWRPRAYDALVRFESRTARADFSVRMEVVNDDILPNDSIPFAIPWPFRLDGARSATGRAMVVRDPAAPVVRLTQPVDPQAAITITVTFHLTPALAAAVDAATAPAASSAGVRCLADWLPWVTARADSAGRALDRPAARYTLRFDVPEDVTAIAAGRVATDVSVAGRRRMTWLTEAPSQNEPAFVVGRLRRIAMRTAPTLTIRVWSPVSDSARAAAVSGTLVGSVREAWLFYGRVFGRLSTEDVDVVVDDFPSARVSGTTLFLSPAVQADSVRIAVARMWWGETVHINGPGARWLEDGLATWSAFQFRAAVEGDSVRERLTRAAAERREPVAALETARRAVGDARFRTAVRAFFLGHRHEPATAEDLLALLGGRGSSVLTSFLQVP
jgi:hypothetical protein